MISQTIEGVSGVPRRRLGELEPLPLAYDLRNKHVRTRRNMAFSTKNTKKFMDPLPDFPLLLPAAHPPIHLRHLDPSHSKILGTPLEGVNIFLKIKNF